MIRRTLSLLVFAPLLWPIAAVAETLPPLAKVIEVAPEQTIASRRFFGRVVARDTVDLAFQVSGQIMEFDALEGHQIKAGDTIAVLDLVPFQLAVRQARAQQEQADRTLARLTQLKGTAVTQVSIDDARTQADVAKIATERVERDLELATLKAPFDGLVATRLTSKFSTLSAGTPVLRLHDMTELHIEIEVPEVLFQNSTESSAVSMSAEFPGRPGRHPLRVVEYAAETSDVGQTVNVTLGMAPPEGQLIPPGSSVTVYVEMQMPQGAITIPLSAVMSDNAGAPAVMLYEPRGETDGVVRRVAVEIEPSESGETQVLSGLAPGQQIVASGGAYLEDGQAVRMFQSFPK